MGLLPPSILCIMWACTMLNDHIHSDISALFHRAVRHRCQDQRITKRTCMSGSPRGTPGCLLQLLVRVTMAGVDKAWPLRIYQNWKQHAGLANTGTLAICWCFALHTVFAKLPLTACISNETLCPCGEGSKSVPVRTGTISSVCFCKTFFSNTHPYE